MKEFDQCIRLDSKSTENCLFSFLKHTMHIDCFFPTRVHDATHILTTKQDNDNFKLLHVMVSGHFGEETKDGAKTGNTSLGSVIEGYHAVVEGGDAIISPELWQNNFSTSMVCRILEDLVSWRGIQVQIVSASPHPELVKFRVRKSVKDTWKTTPILDISGFQNVGHREIWVTN